MKMSEECVRGYNQRYLLYCRAHGKTPIDMMASDEREFPGGKMTGFILWNGRMIEAFRKASPKSFMTASGKCGPLADQAAYTAWLEKQVCGGQGRRSDEEE